MASRTCIQLLIQKNCHISVLICTLENSIIVLSHGFLSLLGNSFFSYGWFKHFSNWLFRWVGTAVPNEASWKARKVLGWGWFFLRHISSLFESAEMEGICCFLDSWGFQGNKFQLVDDCKLKSGLSSFLTLDGFISDFNNFTSSKLDDKFSYQVRLQSVLVFIFAGVSVVFSSSTFSSWRPF